MRRKISCILCPMGCELEVEVQKGKVILVEGNLCERGIKYAKEEVENPTRCISTSIPIQEGGKCETVSVKTSNPIPKDKIFDVMNEIKKVELKAPIKSGDIIIKNVLNLNVDIVATRSVEREI
ncbi:MAG: DUF1667 domain-containing protein [Deltaproteobacteria bacterium]|nr:DUF1667 domain-containing protein [Deltaproteobacteria bacterium]